MPSNTKAPSTIITTGAMSQLPPAAATATDTACSCSRLQMSSLAPPAASSSEPTSALRPITAHMQRLRAVPQPQYTMVAATLT